MEKVGPVSYKVELTNGQERRCHQDQVRLRYVELPNITEPGESQEPIVMRDPELASTEPVPRPETDTNLPTTPVDGDMDVTPSVTPSATPSIPIEPKIYPKRARTKVTRYEPTW